YLDIDAETE
ncbi:hypothetical protein MK338_07510, partial [Streptococcus vestibularis]|nr:hypothetical protein [Streptococcus vestibularis]